MPGDAKPVNVHEAKTHFSRLLARVEAGEEIVIARSGKPVARLVPVEPRPRRRVLGLDAGKIWMAEDCFDPMTEEELKEWTSIDGQDARDLEDLCKNLEDAMSADDAVAVAELGAELEDLIFYVR